MCEERVDNEGWSSPGARERCGVKERRKPARPWQSGEYGGGLSTYSEMAGAKALTREHLSIEGVSGRTKSFVLTSGRWKRSWRLSESDGSNPVAHLGKPRPAGVTGDVRGRSRSFIGEDNTPAGRALERVLRRRAPRERTRRQTVSRQTEAGPAPSSARPTGVGLSQDGPAPRRTNARWSSGFRLRSASKREGLRGRHDASRALGNRAVYGCSYRESIAEVGKKHLSRASEGSRKANRGGAG
jgi:hypothetical protein